MSLCKVVYRDSILQLFLGEALLNPKKFLTTEVFFGFLACSFLERMLENISCRISFQEQIFNKRSRSTIALWRHFTYVPFFFSFQEMLQIAPSLLPRLPFPCETPHGFSQPGLDGVGDRALINNDFCEAWRGVSVMASTMTSKPCTGV